MHTNQVLGWSQLIAERGLTALTYECGSDPEESLVKIPDWLETNGRSYGINAQRIGFWASSNSCISAIKAMRESDT